MTNQKNLAIIPARGGSKRILHKNRKDFLGEPIICYSIRAALEAACFYEVMVSTDDAAIAEISKKTGASVPFLRSEQTSNDHSHLAEVVEEVLNEYQKKGVGFDNVCCILPTAPFVTQEKINAAYRLLQEKLVDSVFPVIQFNYPIDRALQIDNGFVTLIKPEHYTTRSQDLRPAYHDAGQFYWVTTAGFRANKRLFMPKSCAIVISETEAQDIDTIEDWTMAELKYKILKGYTK